MKLIIIIGLIAVVLSQNTISSPKYIQVSQHIIIQKTGTPTTGYEWIAVASNPTIVNVTSSFVASTTIGAPGNYTFNIKGISVGSCNVTLYYKREWQTNAMYTQIHQIVVTPKTTTHAPTTTTHAPTTKAPSTTTTTRSPSSLAQRMSLSL